MENLLLPRRERLFNNGGKLHFQNFSALFQGALSTSFPSGKYHCKAKSLSKTISRLRHIIVKGIKVNPSRRCVAHCSFPHVYTLSRGVPNPKKSEFWWIFGVLDGFVRRRVRVANLAFDQTNSFFRLFVFCSFAPSPQKYKNIFWGPLPYKTARIWWIFGVLCRFRKP